METCDVNSITLPLYDSGRAALITTMEPQPQAQSSYPESAMLRFQRRPELHSHSARGELLLQKRVPLAEQRPAPTVTTSLSLQCKRPSNPFLPVWIVFGPVNSGFRTFSGEVRYERAGAGLA